MTRIAWLAGAVLAAGLAGGVTIAGAQERYAYIGTSMFGTEEVGGKGAGEEALGDFTAEMDLQKGRICYLLEIEGLDGVTAAHIHDGSKTENGPPVVTLDIADSNGDDICQDADAELLKKIAKNKKKYYVNVHSIGFPEGAIRGQLDQ